MKRNTPNFRWLKNYNHLSSDKAALSTFICSAVVGVLGDPGISTVINDWLISKNKQKQLQNLSIKCSKIKSICMCVCGKEKQKSIFQYQKIQ